MNLHLPVFLLLLGLIVFSSSCKEEKGSLDSVEENDPLAGYERMRDSFERIRKQIDYKVSSYENNARTDMLQNWVKQTKGRDGNYLILYAKECLNSGQTEEAIRSIKRVFEIKPELSELSDESKALHDFLAVCYLRMAEQSNCIHNHNDESCIVPIEGGGIHMDPKGSKAAIDKLTEILSKYPEDMKSMWLLNLAYMTLDKYPEQVPDEYLIPVPSKNTDGFYLENIATRTGVDHNDLSGGVIVDDFNNDGKLDIIISSWGFTGSIKYYSNEGEAGFLDKTEESFLSNAMGGLNIKQADFDNDGYLDFIILRGAWKPNTDWGIQPNSLIRNNGDGTFSDVTFESGLYSQRPTQSAEWFDYNNDGWLDLFIVNETTQASRSPFPCEFYVNKGNGTFEEVAKDLEVDFTGYFKAVSSGDIDNDGWKDLYITDLNGPNLLLKNQYKSSPDIPFVNIAAEKGVELPIASFPAWFFDYNNDGLDDIYVASFCNMAFTDQAGQFAREMLGEEVETESNRLYKNTGGGNFEDVTSKSFDQIALSTMGCNYGDLYNEGFPDIYLGTGAPNYNSVVPNRFFSNKSGSKFEDQTFQLGLGHIQKGHGIAFADLDNDGDQDIYAVMGGAFQGDKFPNALYENPGTKNDWIKLKLIGVSANRSAIGAKVKITASVTESGDTREIYHTVSSGASFGGNPLWLHIGLGKIFEIQKLEVDWPDGKNEYLDIGKISANKAYTITQGEKPEELNLKAFAFHKGMKKNHQHSMH